jgi:hypothetical protein
VFFKTLTISSELFILWAWNFHNTPGGSDKAEDTGDICSGSLSHMAGCSTPTAANPDLEASDPTCLYLHFRCCLFCVNRGQSSLHTGALEGPPAGSQVWAPQSCGHADVQQSSPYKLARKNLQLCGKCRGSCYCLLQPLGLRVTTCNTMLIPCHQWLCGPHSFVPPSMLCPFCDVKATCSSHSKHVISLRTTRLAHILLYKNLGYQILNP